jgi:hypothetical protein
LRTLAGRPPVLAEKPATPESVGLSKFGAARNVSTPVLALIANFAASRPTEML